MFHVVIGQISKLYLLDIGMPHESYQVRTFINVAFQCLVNKVLKFDQSPQETYP